MTMNTPEPISPLRDSPIRIANESDQAILERFGTPFMVGDEVVRLVEPTHTSTPKPSTSTAVDPVDKGEEKEVASEISPIKEPPPPKTFQGVEEWTPESGASLQPLPSEALDQMSQKEMMQYYTSLRLLKSMFPKHPEMKVVTEQMGPVHARLIWKGGKDKKEIDAMTMGQANQYLAELRGLDLKDYLTTSSSRIKTAIGMVQRRLTELKKINESLQNPPNHQNENGDHQNRTGDVQNRSGDGQEQNGDTYGNIDPPSDPSMNSSINSAPGGGGDGRRHRNNDHDTVTQAIRVPLGRGDHQTIAKTTTVTTVRRGKRPVVQREHTSTSIPGPDGEDGDDEDDGALIQDGVLKRKRKSRAPKSKARRKKVSRQGGGGGNNYEVIDGYIQYLRSLKRRKTS